MSIKLKINEEIKKNSVPLHFVPFKIDLEDSESKKIEIEKCFNGYTEEKDKVLYNAVRGYPLKGKQMDIPTGYTGIIFSEIDKPILNTTDRTLKAISGGTFDRFTYWNYDRVPSKNDALEKACDWTNLAEVLHKPVDPAELTEFIERQRTET